MSTVTYKDGIMACDTRATAKNIIVPGEITKIFEVDGGLVGICGDAEYSMTEDPEFSSLAQPSQLFEWLKKYERTDFSFEMLVVFSDFPQNIYYCNCEISKEGLSQTGFAVFQIQQGASFSIGSGGDYSDLAIRVSGCSAAEGILHAMTIDAATGGDVYEYEL